MCTRTGHREHHVEIGAPAIPHGGACHLIRVRGALGAAIRTAFPQLEAVCTDGETLLSGFLPDQATLCGVLGEIEAPGLELIEVRCDGTPP